ncbi:tetratricopeptide repeat protein [Acinetobacter sp. ME22]|uniref:tetratricopeptide repeat protein n=1 Tax=Acinetobacter sp. ME22 TaxID=2904802 RepID=UPI001EDAA961|nr:tetratricopeptide repeat protein [Acinetobacter sp. ME22]MCG2573792.1 tetratricopeptide repeat protein [Acinetobacter sp. ME22]
MNLEEAIQQFKQAKDLFEKDEIDQAREIFEQLSSEINPNQGQEFQKAYVSVQVILGEIYQYQGKLEKAIVAYRNIQQEKQWWSARVQFNLGFCCLKQERVEEAILDFKHIPKEEKEWYSKAQYTLGYIYYFNKDFDQAIVFYGNVLESQEELYIKAQWEILSIYLDQNKLHEVYKKFTQIKFDQEQYLREIHYQVNLFKKIIKMKNRDQYFLMFSKIKKILSLLIIEQDKDNLIAHYTTPSVAYLMLDHKNQQQVSKLRLNPTDFMNDPTEGALIHQLFSLKAQEKPNAQIEQHKSFIGCFTLHHDSLNQFRLYGKENQREASGVSLVMNRSTLFENQSNFNFLNHNVFILEQVLVDLRNLKIQQKEDSENSKEQPKFSDLKLPLYRCIYFDPDSGLIHVAQREEWTFCREKGSCQDNGWEEYKLKIDQVNKSVRELIADIQKLIKEINPAENSDEAELIEEILLPLRYLIKHYAFKEEQECRTIYITQWNDEKIDLDPKLNRIYVDYQSILPAMEKIFLSVGALQHESTLQYLGQTADKTFNVKRSHNPFRT